MNEQIHLTRVLELIESLTEISHVNYILHMWKATCIFRTSHVLKIPMCSLLKTLISHAICIIINKYSIARAVLHIIPTRSSFIVFWVGLIYLTSYVVYINASFLKPHTSDWKKVAYCFPTHAYAQPNEPNRMGSDQPRLTLHGPEVEIVSAEWLIGFRLDWVGFEV